MRGSSSKPLPHNSLNVFMLTSVRKSPSSTVQIHSNTESSVTLGPATVSVVCCLASTCVSSKIRTNQHCLGTQINNDLNKLPKTDWTVAGSRNSKLNKSGKETYRGRVRNNKLRVSPSSSCTVVKSSPCRDGLGAGFDNYVRSLEDYTFIN